MVKIASEGREKGRTKLAAKPKAGAEKKEKSFC
jgi:hypothetical protein